MPSRKVVSRAYRPPRARQDRETSSFLEDDPSGRGQGWHSGKAISSADEIVAKKFWDEKEPWPVYWEKWKRERAERVQETNLWLRDFKEHGVAYANRMRARRQRRVVLICETGSEG